jgi:hypothetical protein
MRSNLKSSVADSIAWLSKCLTGKLLVDYGSKLCYDNRRAVRSFHKETRMKTLSLLVLAILTILVTFFVPKLVKGQTEKPTLVQAVVCEDMKDGSPINQGIVFPVGAGKVVCYSTFDPVPRKTFIYHNWYRKDELNTSIRLVLQPPRWACYSTIQLREIDKGPWRIEITDQEGQVLSILRFSITD